MKKSRNRSGQVVMLVFLFMMVILAINVCYLCTTGKTMISNVNVRDFAKNRGGGQVTKVVQAARGTIYTSDNEIVASDVKKYKLRAILAKRLDAKKNPQYVRISFYISSFCCKKISTVTHSGSTLYSILPL